MAVGMSRATSMAKVGPDKAAHLALGRVLGQDAAHGQAGFVFDALGHAGDQARVIGQVAGDLPEGLRGDGHHDALRPVDGARQVGLQHHLARHFDAGQKAIVAARLADFVQPLGDMPPERDLVPP